MKKLFVLLICILAMGCVRRQVITTTGMIVETQVNEIILIDKKKRKTVSSPKVRNKRQLEKVIQIDSKQRMLPYERNGNWNYTNIETGKPVNTSHKLSL